MAAFLKNPSATESMEELLIALKLKASFNPLTIWSDPCPNNPPDGEVVLEDGVEVEAGEVAGEEVAPGLFVSFSTGVVEEGTVTCAHEDNVTEQAIIGIKKFRSMISIFDQSIKIMPKDF
jgi:hypothetical protein